MIGLFPYRVGCIAGSWRGFRQEAFPKPPERKAVGPGIAQFVRREAHQLRLTLSTEGEARTVDRRVACWSRAGSSPSIALSVVPVSRTNLRKAASTGLLPQPLLLPAWSLESLPIRRGVPDSS